MLHCSSKSNKKSKDYNMIHFLERDLSEYLDDLLVAEKIEQPRTKQSVTSADAYADGFVNFKMAPRIQVRFELTNRSGSENYIVIKYHDKAFKLSLVTCKPVSAKTPAHIAKIIPLVQQMFAAKKHEIMDACREELDYQNWKRAQKKNKDDALPCDGIWAEEGHLLGERKRPWLENKKSKEK